jgi:hypothetical protein
VIVEIQIKGERYRKVFSPPYYKLDFKRCIGDLYDINHYAFLYLPKHIDIAHLLNDILTVNMTEKLNKTAQQKVFKIADYIDGITGNTTYPLFTHQTKYQMDIKNPIQCSNDFIAQSISNITHNKTIVGIDDFEHNFDLKHLKTIQRYLFQTIIATNDESIIQSTNNFVTQLLSGDQEADYQTLSKRVKDPRKTYILVEGKYDVSWFERALEVLNLSKHYTVLPCGGSGNIQYVKNQLDKEGIPSLTITDGDTHKKHSLKRDVIELYADLSFVNQRFRSHFKQMPRSKKVFFKRIDEKDDVIKHILSNWAKHNLTKDSEFVKELKSLL